MSPTYVTTTSEVRVELARSTTASPDVSRVAEPARDPFTQTSTLPVGSTPAAPRTRMWITFGSARRTDQSVPSVRPLGSVLVTVSVRAADEDGRTGGSAVGAPA